MRSSALVTRVTRYTIGSIVAVVVSEITFAVLFATGVPTTPDNVAAFVAGAIPNWILNRRWAWQKRGQLRFGREVVGYLVTSVISLAASSVATAWAHDVVKDHHVSHTASVAIVTLTYLASYLVLFVLKFIAYEVWIFSDHRRVRDDLRSRRQVRTTTRPNRTP